MDINVNVTIKGLDDFTGVLHVLSEAIYGWQSDYLLPLQSQERSTDVITELERLEEAEKAITHDAVKSLAARRIEEGHGKEVKKVIAKYAEKLSLVSDTDLLSLYADLENM